MASFSVFPPPQVPRIAMPNPHNRKPSLTKDIVSHKELVNAGITEYPVPKIPAAHLRQTGRSTPSPGVNKALSTNTPTQSIKNSPQVNHNYSQNEITSKQKSSPKQGSIGSTSTLVRSTTPDGRPKSPVIPIRSMFPVYNPSLPLASQNYYPQRPAAIHTPVPTSKYSRQDLRTYMSAPIDYEVGARTAPASVADIPLEAINSREAQFSSPRALERLWEATHGTEPNTTIGSFDLELARYVNLSILDYPADRTIVGLRKRHSHLVQVQLHHSTVSLRTTPTRSQSRKYARVNEMLFATSCYHQSNLWNDVQYPEMDWFPSFSQRWLQCLLSIRAMH